MYAAELLMRYAIFLHGMDAQATKSRPSIMSKHGEVMVKSVMIVDDDFVTRYIVRDVLETAGYRVVAEASSGEEAITKYIQVVPDIVIMDIILPNINGLVASKEILSANSSAKIIMISVLDNTLLNKAAIKLGVLDFLHKPFTPEQILEVIQNAAAK
jgi:two-component system chemotaxis response regulator CheY